MPRSGPKKYDWRPGPVTAEMLHRHLRGEVTLGAELRRRSGIAFAVCWDADNAADFAVLLDAARQLRKSGPRPVLERSPTAGKHRGGGRLWLFFARPIDPGRAWATAVKRASALARCNEFWPTLGLGPEDRGQAVRLPAGLYQPEGAWCELAEFADAPTWLTGPAAAALILAALTPTDWVTEPTPPMPHRPRRMMSGLPTFCNYWRIAAERQRGKYCLRREATTVCSMTMTGYLARVTLAPRRAAMSLHPLAVYLVPEDTARVAHAAFPKGHPYLALRDELGAIFADRCSGYPAHPCSSVRHRAQFAQVVVVPGIVHKGTTRQ